MYQSYIKKILIRFLFMALLLFITMYVYCEWIASWTDYGRFSSKLFRMEYPLLFYTYIILYFPKKDSKWLDYHLFYPLVTLMGVYLLYDVLYSYLDRPIRFSDIEDLTTLFSLMPWHTISIFVYLVAIFVLPVFLCASTIKKYSLKYSMAVFSSKLAFACMLIVFLSSSLFFNYQNNYIDYDPIFIARNIRKNGRISYSLYCSHRSQQIMAQLQQRTNHIDVDHILWRGEPHSYPNIHIIILESFCNPYLIKNIEFNIQPLHPHLAKYLIEQQHFSIVQSPVYGGATPQSEFEILTGTPALGVLGSVDFNRLEGTPVSSFVHRLKKSGYSTVASIATPSMYFNSMNAYPSMGFEKVHFTNKNSYFFKHPKDKNIFDGDLLQANVKYVEQHIRQSKQPIFNYVLGIYGHMPGHQNFETRPKIITANNIAESHHLQWVANDFYYRTKALADYLDYLQKIDPQAIILVISDHLPAIFDQKVVYSKNKYDNIAILMVKGKVIDISGHRYYQIPHIIWSYLQKDDPEKIEPYSQEILKECYLEIMSQGIGIKH